MTVHQIVVQPILEPRWNNKRVSSYRDWLADNEEALAHYYHALVTHGGELLPDDIFDWLPCKWECVRSPYKEGA